MVQKLFKDISYLQLWWPSCSAEGNHLGNFGRGHNFLGTFLWNNFEFGPVFQEEMSFKDISYLQLWLPSFWGEQNHLGNCSRGHFEEQFGEIIFIWTIDLGDVIQRYFLSTALAAICLGKQNHLGNFFVADIYMNISMKLFLIWTSDSGEDVV